MAWVKMDVTGKPMKCQPETERSKAGMPLSITEMPKVDRPVSSVMMLKGGPEEGWLHLRHGRAAVVTDRSHQFGQIVMFTKIKMGQHCRPDTIEVSST